MSGLRVLVTGASRGIGLGIAEALADRGHQIWGCARASDAPSLFTSGPHRYQSVDLTAGDACRQMINQAWGAMGGVDVLVNNAGMLPPTGFVRDITEGIERHLALNIGAVMHTSSALLALAHAKPEALSQGYVTVVNISSGAAHGDYAGWAVYCAGKAAVERFSSVCAAEEAEAGHRIHALAPGVVDTDMQAYIRQQDPEQFETVRRLIEAKKADAFQNSAQSADAILALATSATTHPSTSVDVRAFG